MQMNFRIIFFLLLEELGETTRDGGSNIWLHLDRGRRSVIGNKDKCRVLTQVWD